MRSNRTIASFLSNGIIFSVKRSFLLLFIFAGILNVCADENKTAIDSANAAYSKGSFDKAIKLYESVTAKNVEAAGLYFNLGNAYFKTNNIALAILNYERAKKLDPDDEDINTNLKIANQKIEDKIDPAPQLFLTQWKNSLINIMSEKSWSWLCIILFLSSLLFFAIYITFSNRNLKQVGFFGGVIVIILSICTYFIAEQKYSLTKYSSDAIITTASVTVMGSPNEKGTKLFLLHEGTKVNVSQESDDWTEIKIANGNVGWVKSKELTAI